MAKDQQRKAADEVLTLQGRQDHYDLLLESLRLSCETMEQELSGLDRRETDGRGRMGYRRTSLRQRTARRRCGRRCGTSWPARPI